jgi:hypothetical protein
MNKDKALRLALEALEYMNVTAERYVDKQIPENAIATIKKALAQTEQDGECKYCTDGCPACDARKLPKQEPVAFINVEQRKLEWAKYMSWDTPTVVNLPKIPLYTTPPQRIWVGLTEAECGVLWKVDMTPFDYYKVIEAKLKEKNS